MSLENLYEEEVVLPTLSSFQGHQNSYVTSSSPKQNLLHSSLHTRTIQDQSRKKPFAIKKDRDSALISSQEFCSVRFYQEEEQEEMAVAMGSCNPVVFFNNPNLKTIPLVVCYQRPPKRRVEIILNRQKGAAGIIGNHQSFQFSRDNQVDVVDDEGDDNGFSAEEWRREMREREVREILKEIEDMKELERRAEELQAKMGKSAEAVLAEETEEKKRQRVRKELEKLAKEQAERREQAKLMFDLGQKAYGRGSYGRATEFFEAALTVVPGQTLLGGEIQIWLAMTYDARNRHRDCIALYQELERRHPSLSIRRQAAGLRYILQAPKLKISDEERLTIPLIGSSYDNYASYWPDKYKDKPKKGYEAKTSQVNSTKDYLGDFLVFRAPKGWEDSRVFWLYLSACVGLVGLAFLQK